MLFAPDSDPDVGPYSDPDTGLIVGLGATYARAARSVRCQEALEALAYAL